MLESIFKTPVLQTSDKHLFSVYTQMLKENNISYSVKLMDLNSRGGLNDVMTFTPHTEFKKMNTIYTAHDDEKKALYLLNLARKEVEKAD